MDKDSGSIGFVEDTDDDISEAEKGRPGDEEVRDSPINRLMLDSFVFVMDRICNPIRKLFLSYSTQLLMLSY